MLIEREHHLITEHYERNPERIEMHLPGFRLCCRPLSLQLNIHLSAPNATFRFSIRYDNYPGTG